MLSRLALRNAQALPLLAHSARASSSANVPRPKRLEHPAPVRHGFIPEEWFTFFYPKTGASGPYMFVASLATYLVSKEIYVLEHEYYNGLSMLIIWVYGVKKFGPKVAAFLDKGIDDYEKQCNASRDETIKAYEKVIEDEKAEQSRTEVQKLIMDVKKENVKVQLEAAYRERIAHVYNEVKRRLDYQIQIQNIERKIAQKHMSQWIINNVLKAITPDQEKAALNQCITDLQALAQRA